MTSISKLEYLKKYMDGKNDKTKKRKKKVKKSRNNIKIVDNDTMFNDIKTMDSDGEFDLQEEKPLLYALDGATVLTKELEESIELRKSKWAPLSSFDKDNNSNKYNGDNLDLSPVRNRKKRHDSSDSDISPVRMRKRHDSSGSSDLSPEQQKRTKKDLDSDLSPVRRGRCKKDSDIDLSPVRKKNRHENEHRKEEIPEIMSSGKKAGLRTGAELREENERKRKQEMQQINKMDTSVSGKGAATIYRDKSGKKIDLKFEELEKRRAEEEKLKQIEEHARWGKGLAQEKNYQQKLQDDLNEVEKPLARYKDDKDLDVLLKNQDREGDPMLAFISKSKNKKTKASKPKYNGPPPAPNRFNIWPGYRYDGVDRSNGFEKKRFTAINKAKSLTTDAYKWSVEDM